MYAITGKLLRILNSRQRSFAALLVLLMIIGALLESLGVSLIYPLVEAVSSAEGWDETWYSRIIIGVFGIDSYKNYVVVLIVLTIAVFIFKNLYLIFEKWIQFSFIAKCRLKLQKRLMNSYLHKPYEFFLSSSSGEIVRIVTGDTMETFDVLTATLTIYTEGIICVILAITVIAMDPAISAVFIAVFAVNFIVVTKVIKPVMKRTGKTYRQHSAKTNRWILEAIEGIKSVKVCGSESFFETMYIKNADVAVDSQRKSSVISAIPKLFNETFSVSAALTYVLVLIVSGVAFDNIIPVLSVFAIAALRLMPCINSISANINTVSNKQGGLNNILNIIGEDNEPGSEMQTEHSSEAITFDKCIELRNINFNYPGSDKVILRNANIKINKGDSVGIVGVSGGGKTTTADIILGLIRTQKGHVLVDGCAIDDKTDSWRNIISCVPQRVFVMDDTIRNNVAFGVSEKEISEEAVRNAIKDAQLDEFVQSLPDGLNTVVGERGIRLSGGQCQRLGIARALYRNPEVILFDEATSSLDNETENAIMDSIYNLKGTKTLIIIAHRLTTLKNCNVIFRVENETIVRQ